MILLTKDRVFPRLFTHGRDLSPHGGTSAGGQSINGGGTHERDLTLIDYILN